jgi:DNA-binding winged helix-turn-helix (wHTH) protein/TolB-like protein
MAQPALVIGRFTLQPGRQLLCGAEPLPLGVKPLKLLAALVEAPGQVVTKDELMEKVWPGLIVEENTLQAQVSALRKALGEEGRWIATVPGRGYRFDGPSVRPETTSSGPVAAARRRPVAWLAGLAAALVLVVGFVALRWVDAARPAASASRYLVLPFANRTGDASKDDLADALTDETASRLAAKAWDASVVAHNEAFAYRNQAVDEAVLGRQRGLDYIVEGTVQSADPGVEVMVTLVDGRNGVHLGTTKVPWSATDPPTMRGWVAAALSDQLLLLVGQDRRRRLAAAGDRDETASRLITRASIAFNEERVGDGWVNGLALLDRALELEPHNAHALFLAGDARTGLVSNMVFHTEEERAALLARADESLTEALRLQPNRPAIHRSLGNLRVVQGRHDAARAEYQRALELDPTDLYALGSLAMGALYDGHPDQTLAMLDRAKPISASNLYYVYGTVAQARLHLGQDEAALDALRHALAIDAEDPWGWTYFIGLLQLTGKTAELPDALARLKALSPGTTIARLRGLDAETSPYYRAQQERFYDALAKAGVPPGERATTEIDAGQLRRP